MLTQDPTFLNPFLLRKVWPKTEIRTNTQGLRCAVPAGAFLSAKNPLFLITTQWLRCAVPAGAFLSQKMHFLRKKGVHETRMNRMRAKYERNCKMFKYLRIHTYFIGICICFCYTFCLLINHNGFHKGGRAAEGGAPTFVEVAGGHPHYGWWVGRR